MLPFTSNSTWQRTTVSQKAINKPSKFRYEENGESQLATNEIDSAIESFTKALQHAEERHHDSAIPGALTNLGKAYLDKKRYAFAAKILNGAFALNPDTENSNNVLSLLAELETRMIKSECANARSSAININPADYLRLRKRLSEIRQIVHTKIFSGSEPQHILEEFSTNIGAFLFELTKEMYPVLGPPPCEYAFLSLGSLARKEMCPYSDLEFAILIKETTPKNVDYFKKMVKWLEIKVINLGETEIKILQQGRVSPVARGFSFDDGGNTPLGKEGYVELINTPKGLAQFQSERSYSEDLILSNVLREANFLFGSKKLFDKYVFEMKAVLERKETNQEFTVGQNHCLKLIRGHLVEFEPQLGQNKVDNSHFNIKAELLRLPVFLISCLADFFLVDELSTWNRIEGLCQKKIIKFEASFWLKKTINAIVDFRIRCHLFYRRECDVVYHPIISQRKFTEQQIKKMFVLTSGEINTITEIFLTIFSLYNVFKEASSSSFSKPSLFYETSFRELDLAFYAEILVRKGKFQDAKLLLNRAIALDPCNNQAVFILFNIYIQDCDYGKAKECLYQALAVNPINTPVLLRLANLHFFLKEYSEAKQSLSTFLEKDPSNTTAQLALANLHFFLKEFSEAKQSFVIFLEKNPKQCIGLLAYIELLIQLKAYREVKPYIETALSLKRVQDKVEMKSRYLFYKGLVHQFYQEHKEALECFSTASNTYWRLYSTAEKKLSKLKQYRFFARITLLMGEESLVLGDRKTANHALYRVRNPAKQELFHDSFINQKNIYDEKEIHLNALKLASKIYGDEYYMILPEIYACVRCLHSLRSFKELKSTTFTSLDLRDMLLDESKSVIPIDMSEESSEFMMIMNGNLEFDFSEKPSGFHEDIYFIFGIVEKFDDSIGYGNYDLIYGIYQKLGELLEEFEDANALHLFEKAIFLARKNENEENRKASFLEFENASRKFKKEKEFLQYTEASLATARRENKFRESAQLLFTLSRIYIDSGERKKGMTYAEDALNEVRKIGDHIETINALKFLGTLFSTSGGESYKSYGYFAEALQLTQNFSKQDGESKKTEIKETESFISSIQKINLGESEIKSSIQLVQGTLKKIGGDRFMEKFWDSHMIDRKTFQLFCFCLVNAFQKLGDDVEAGKYRRLSEKFRDSTEYPLSVFPSQQLNQKKEKFRVSTDYPLSVFPSQQLN